MIETTRAEEWIYNTLTADSALSTLLGGNDKIFRQVATRDVTLPYVVYQNQSARDIWGVGPIRIMTHLTYAIKAITPGHDVSLAEDIADRIDTLLQGASGATSDGRVIGCVRERIFTYTENDENKFYQHLGGIYRIYAQPLS